MSWRTWAGGVLCLLSGCEAGPGRAPDSAAAPDGGGVLGAVDCRVPSSWPTEWAEAEEEVLRQVNAQRESGASCGGAAKAPASPLEMQAALREAARCHALDMATQDFVSHQGSNGSSVRERVNAVGYAWRGLAENVAAGQATAAEALASWVSSAGHCDNLMGATFEQTGVGYVLLQPDDGDVRYRHYWTHVFARP